MHGNGNLSPHAMEMEWRDRGTGRDSGIQSGNAGHARHAICTTCSAAVQVPVWLFRAPYPPFHPSNCRSGRADERPIPNSDIWHHKRRERLASDLDHNLCGCGDR
jgi:hypothetical protein